MKFLKKLFGISTYEYMLTITLKSGKQLNIRCDNYNLKYNGAELTEHKIDGMCKADCIWFSLSEVAAVSAKKI
jgi:hypothetical protein